MPSKKYVLLILSLIVLGSAVLWMFGGHTTTQTSGLILRATNSDAYTSNKLAEWNHGLSEQRQADGTGDPVEFAISASPSIELTREQDLDLAVALKRSIDHLQSPDWAAYFQSKKIGGTRYALGDVFSAFESYWMPDNAKLPPSEQRAQGVWNFIYNNPNGATAPRLVQVLDRRVDVRVTGVADPVKANFEALRRTYDGLATRAKDDVIAMEKDPNEGDSLVAQATLVGVTSLNATPSPVCFTLLWSSRAQQWWPATLSSSHPAYSPFF